MKIAFISLGCSKNLVVTEEMIGLFKKHNYDIKEDNKDKIKEKEEEPVTQSKPSYFNRYSRKKFESRKKLIAIVKDMLGESTSGK